MDRGYSLGVYFVAFVSVSATCPNKVLLEMGKRATIGCHYENYGFIGWSINQGSYLIYYENSAKSGTGYDSKEYDILPDGSLIIANVTIQHEQQYTVRVTTAADVPLSSVVNVKVFVSPDPEYPVINGMVSRPQLVLGVERLWTMECTMNNVRPAIILEWFCVDSCPSDELAISNDTVTRDNGDGTFSIRLRSHFQLKDAIVQRLNLLCAVIGPEVLSSNASAALLFQPVKELPVPIIGGCSDHIMQCGREGNIHCTAGDLPSPNYTLKWITFGDGLRLNKGDPLIAEMRGGSYTISVEAKYNFVDNLIPVMPIRCVLSGRYTTQSSSVVYLGQEPPVPVIDGCYSSECTYVVTTATGQLTCTVMGVTISDVRIEWRSLGAYNGLNLEQTHQSSRAASGAVTRSLRYSLDQPSAVPSVKLQCRLYGTGLENPIRSANVTIEVQHSNGEADRRHHRVTAATLASLIIIPVLTFAVLGCLYVLCIKNRNRERETEVPLPQVTESTT